MKNDENDRREFRRKITTIKAVLTLGEPIEGEILNASLTGFLFDCPAHDSVGQTGELRIHGITVNIPVTVVDITTHGTHLSYDASTVVLTQMASESDDFAALLIQAITKTQKFPGSSE
jgi:hypothetical protein